MKKHEAPITEKLTDRHWFANTAEASLEMPLGFDFAST
jgi:hypothetical protein